MKFLTRLSIAIGAALLIWPLVWPSQYLAAPVWLGFIFLLDPINERLGGESLARDCREGRVDRLVNLMLSGFLCGILWEFWNYWSRAKWHYTVPIMEHLKIFEMPVPGYLGFPAFALECFTMYLSAHRHFQSPRLEPARPYDRVVICQERRLNRRLMPAILEREIKLRFASPEEARAAVIAAGATPVRGRRLQEDCLVDTTDEMLRGRRSALRVRVESGKSLITFKGPVQPAEIKMRDELETVVGDGPLVLTILESLGFQVWFRYQKYREEFAIDDVIVAVDETPVGTFVEIEGGARGITEMAEALGREPKDYLLDSYRGLYSEHCRQRGLPVTDMLFEDDRKLDTKATDLLPFAF